MIYVFWVVKVYLENFGRKRFEIYVVVELRRFIICVVCGIKVFVCFKNFYLLFIVLVTVLS